MTTIPEPFHWRAVANEVPTANFAVLAYSEVEYGFSLVEWDSKHSMWRSDAVVDRRYPRSYFTVWMYVPLLPKLLPEPYVEDQI